MEATELLKRAHIAYPALSITRLTYDGKPTELGKGCTLKTAFPKAFAGEEVYVQLGSGGCGGGNTGFGFTDGLPDIKGGFGHFISHGRGEGYPQGERIKCTPELAEQMMQHQPQQVMETFDTIRIKPWEITDNADTVTLLVKPDSLSALVHLYNYRHPDFDNVIAPMSSGCASILRIPFGEMLAGRHRAVIGNVDIASRPYFDEESFFFTLSNDDFVQMLKDADESIFFGPFWKHVEKRMTK